MSIDYTLTDQAIGGYKQNEHKTVSRAIMLRTLQRDGLADRYGLATRKAEKAGMIAWALPVQDYGLGAVDDLFNGTLAEADRTDDKDDKNIEKNDNRKGAIIMVKIYIQNEKDFTEVEDSILKDAVKLQKRFPQSQWQVVIPMIKSLQALCDHMCGHGDISEAFFEEHYVTLDSIIETLKQETKDARLESIMTSGLSENPNADSLIEKVMTVQIH